MNDSEQRLPDTGLARNAITRAQHIERDARNARGDLDLLLTLTEAVVLVGEQLSRVADRMDSWSYQQAPESQVRLRIGEGA